MGRTAIEWWTDLAPRLDREMLAVALTVGRSDHLSVVRGLMRRDAILPGDPESQRQFGRLVIGDSVGIDLPMTVRISLARRCARLPWREVAGCVRNATGCSEAQLDRWLADAGAGVADRMKACGLSQA